MQRLPKAYSDAQAQRFLINLCTREKEKMMYLLVMFDLPVKPPSQRKAAARFRHDLLKDGYTMLQYSVYARFIRGKDYYIKHMKRLERMTPLRGLVHVLAITEPQFKSMRYLVGDITKKTNALRDQLLLEL